MSSRHTSNEQSRLRDGVCFLFCAHGVAEAPTPLDDNNNEPWDEMPYSSRYGNDPWLSLGRNGSCIRG
jgi:hypothetical protein